MEPVTPSRRGTFDLPKPETGLAEWTSKIKALQRQVDADEEAEQKRLEEEIAAARRARLHRSRGPGYGGDSIDLTASPSALGIPSSRLNKTPSPDKQNGQDDAVRKLVGTSFAPNVDTSSITQGVLPRPSQFPTIQPPPSLRQEPVSLASFIGGRATGPRLNRHAPQQNAHDPTQFEQRIFDAPHPIFGKGGVAMPGMVIKPGSSVRDAVKASEAVERYQPRLPKRTSTPSLARRAEETSTPRPISPQKSGSRERTISTPSVAKKYMEQIEQRPVSPQKSGGRERTLSTPGPSPPILNSTDIFPSRQAIVRSTTTESSVESRPRSPQKGRPSSTPSRSLPQSRTPVERPTTPHRVPTIWNTPASPAKSSVSTPSLTRSVIPEPRLPSQTPVNSVPSSAFHKPPPPKDPTPSISRLQGRGFVQNMVKASSQLENSAKPAPSTPTPKPMSGRKSTVLDRWQAIIASPTPSPASIPRQAPPVRKAFSDISTRSDPPATQSPTSSSATPSPGPNKVLKTKTSRGLLHPDPLSPPEPLSPRRAKLAEKMFPPDGSAGFGSATTMVVYKPKTPEPSPEKSLPTASVDELGVRRDTSSGDKGKPRFSVPSELPGPTGKPLNHPTKERVRKPKKSKNANGGIPSQIKSAEPIEEINPFREASLPLLRSPRLSHTPSPGSSNDPPPSSLLSRTDVANTVKPPTDKETTSKVAQITQKWGQSAPIGVKALISPSFEAQAQTFQTEMKYKMDTTLIRKVLPGMVAAESLRTPPVVTKSKSPSPESTLQVSSSIGTTGSSQDASPSGTSGYTSSPSSTEGQSRPPGPVKGDKTPRSPPSSPKHTRIPSTGNRALVMDVAQALSDYNGNFNGEGVKPQEEIKSPVLEAVPEPIAKPRAPPTLERRRSSYDRFSVVSVMPPLKEEATPNGTPFGTLTRTPDTLSRNATPNKQAVDAEGLGRSGQKDVVHFDVDDTPLPVVDVLALIRSRKAPPLTLPDVKTISVDVFAINGVSSTAISPGADIFYDSETLAIVHRYKSQTSGLVSTQLWVWYGMKSNVGEKGERKLQELAKRYNTSPTLIHQNSEPPQLVQLLGGQLVIRQGNRSHWSADNTTMYSVRRLGGVIHIDEHELSIKNLCSAFSYCLTILDTVYVWHGCGSTESERQAAIQYASRIGKEGPPAIQLHEGEDDNDELFWMALGDDGYAKADYWRWRRHTSEADPQIWSVDAKTNPPVTATPSLRGEDARGRSVYILDCVWELFVMVGYEARADRRSIKLALRIAQRFAQISASSRPFTPTVHVLVLPSRLPLDLRLNLRELDDAEVNNNEMPDHMNLLSSGQAESHLQQQSWERIALQDQTMLPLGVSASDT